VAIASVPFTPLAMSEDRRALSTVAELVAQCREEASRGHRRQIHIKLIKGHRERMSELCVAWRKVSAHEREALLQRCREAMVAASVRPHGVSDRGHGVRLRMLCERLHEATT